MEAPRVAVVRRDEPRGRRAHRAGPARGRPGRGRDRHRHLCPPLARRLHGCDRGRAGSRRGSQADTRGGCSGSRRRRSDLRQGAVRHSGAPTGREPREAKGRQLLRGVPAHRRPAPRGGSRRRPGPRRRDLPGQAPHPLAVARRGRRPGEARGARRGRRGGRRRLAPHAPRSGRCRGQRRHLHRLRRPARPAGLEAIRAPFPTRGVGSPRGDLPRLGEGGTARPRDALAGGALHRDPRPGRPRVGPHGGHEHAARAGRGRPGVPAARRRLRRGLRLSRPHRRQHGPRQDAAGDHGPRLRSRERPGRAPGCRGRTGWCPVRLEDADQPVRAVVHRARARQGGRRSARARRADGVPDDVGPPDGAVR